MFSNIKTEEVIIFAKICANGFTDENGEEIPPIPKEEILDEIELIDNMLSVMKSASLLNKKRGVRKMLDGLLAISVGDQSVIPGASNNHLIN